MFPSSEAFEKHWREGNLQAISIRSVSYQHGWESWRINWTRHRCRSRTLQTWLRSRGSADDRLYSQNSSCLDWRVAQMLGLLLRLCHVNGSVLNRHPAQPWYFRDIFRDQTRVWEHALLRSPKIASFKALFLSFLNRRESGPAASSCNVFRLTRHVGGGDARESFLNGSVSFKSLFLRPFIPSVH